MLAQYADWEGMLLDIHIRGLFFPCTCDILRENYACHQEKSWSFVEMQDLSSKNWTRSTQSGKYTMQCIGWLLVHRFWIEILSTRKNINFVLGIPASLFGCPIHVSCKIIFSDWLNPNLFPWTKGIYVNDCQLLVDSVACQSLGSVCHPGSLGVWVTIVTIQIVSCVKAHPSWSLVNN